MSSGRSAVTSPDGFLSMATRSPATVPAIPPATLRNSKRWMLLFEDIETTDAMPSMSLMPEACAQLLVLQIAEAAYYRWLNRGRTHGHDLEDWLKAEHQLKR